MCAFPFFGIAQTLIINEVSNGPSGSQEYVEFVVIDNTVTYDCNGSAPPCIDIRGWIFDDNSGYHGTSGTASGAVRFSQDPLWSCVPLGTIILVYNGIDPNISLPADDFSMNDGNCTLVIPLDNLTYFEFTETTPGDVACSYPTTGWGSDPSPTWSNVALANGGDCARIVDLNGCEVFSLCYGSCSSNPLIYFTGSGSDDVWYFNDGDPAVQSNWNEGCAGDISACGSNDQTPGAPNNTANQNYIAQFNNNCAPITPLTSSGQVTNLVCGCNSSAEVSASGSISPYTYEWLDSNYDPIGQSSSTATGLCGGTYYAVTTSHIGCTDTAQVIIQNSSSSFAGNDVVLEYCDLSGSIDLFNELGGSPDAGGSWNGPSALTGGDQGTFDPTLNVNGIYEYVVTGSGGCPNDTAFVDIENNYSPSAGTGMTIAVCSSVSAFNLADSLTGTVDPGGTWSGPSALSGGDLGTFDPGFNVSGAYQYVVTGSGICLNDTAFVTVSLDQVVNAGVGGNLSVCEDEPSFDLFDELSGGPASGGVWQPVTTQGNGIFDPAVDPSGTYLYVVSGAGACPDDTASLVVDVNVVPTIQVSITDISCFGANDGAIDLSVTPTGSTVTWTMPGGGTVQQEDISGLYSAQYFYEVVTSQGCTDTATLTLTQPAALDLQLQVTNQTCPGSCDGSVVASVSNGVAPFDYLFNGVSNGSNQISNLCGGNVNITVVDANGCSESTNTSIASNGQLSEPVITGPSEICINDGTIVLTADIPGGTWSGNGVDPSSGVFDPSIGTGTADVVYTISGTCGGDDTLSILVNDVPEIDISVVNDQGCAPLTVGLENLATNQGNTSCIWTLSDGTTVNGCMTDLTLTQEGCYDVSLQVTSSEGCSVSEVYPTQVCVSGQPDPGFSINSYSFSNIDSELEAVADDNSLVSYTWFFGGLEAGQEITFNYTFSDLSSGTTELCLAVENGVGCMDTSCVEVSYKQDFSIYVPNSFTPNGDGVNDEFYPVSYSSEFEEFEMIVVNRWGTVFFQSNDLTNSIWDGTLYGVKVPEDVYVWKITYRETGSPLIEGITGHVSLIR